MYKSICKKYTIFLGTETDLEMHKTVKSAKIRGEIRLYDALDREMHKYTEPD